MKNFPEINRTSIPIGVKKNCTNLIQSLAKTLLVSLLCTFGVGEMWAYWYVPGSINGDRWNKDHNQMNGSSEITFFAVQPGTYEYKLNYEGKNDGWGNGVATNNSPSYISDITDGQNGGNNSITVDVACNLTFHITNGSLWQYEVTANPPAYYIKYQFGNTNDWTIKEMFSNLDGTYSCQDYYHGSASGYNFRKICDTSDEFIEWHDGTSGVTLVNGVSSSSDKCIFTINPSSSSEISIRKCNTVNTETDQNSYIYFDNANAEWTGTNRYFVIGRPEASKVYQMYAIANTKLWYIPDSKALDNWGDCGYYGIAVNSTAWSNGDWGPNNLANANQHYTAPYLIPQNLDSKYYYIVKKADGTDGGAVTFEKQTMSYTCLNLTVGYQYNVDGVDMTSGGAPAQITMTSYYFSNRFTATANEAQIITKNSSGTYSKSVSGAYRGTTTLTMSNLNNGYIFKGWYDGDTELSTDASYTFYPNANTTVTAKFETRWSVAGSWDGSKWNETAYMFGNIGTDASGNDTCSYSFTTPTTIDENANYRFKIIDHSVNPKSWYGLSSTNIIEYTTNDMPWTLGTGEGYEANCEINTAAAGTYKFIWNITQHKLTVTYPTSYQITMATNPSTGGSTTTPSGTFWVGTDAFDITATPNYSHHFTGWTSSNGGSFKDDDPSKASTKFTATANTTLTAVMPERTAFIEGLFQVRKSDGTTVRTGDTWQNASTNIPMDYDARENRYYLHTYSTPTELAQKIEGGDALFVICTSTSSSNVFTPVRYGTKPYAVDENNRLSEPGRENGKDTVTGPTARGIAFSGTEEANVILYFDGSKVWYTLEEKKTFTDGASTGYWNNASNWSPSGVPVITDMVYINKPVTVDMDHAKAKRIILDQNNKTGKLTIQANKGLEVLQTIKRTTDGSNRLATRAEDLILESSASGNASLIFDNSNSDAATVQMYSPASISGDWNWQFMGTPFTSANALYSYYGAYLYEWQSTGTWDAVANGGTMTAFTGYCITQDDPTTYVMDGTLNPTSSDKAISIPAGLEFVMANSWTAPISVCNFTNTTLPLDNQTIYLFNTGHAESDASAGSAAGTYIAMPINSAVYTGNYLIAPMEGFYVNNIDGSAVTVTLKYDELVRPSGSHTDIVAGAMHAPKRVDAVAEPDVMKIKVIGSRYADRVVILARPDFSAGFDNGWDGKNLNEPGVAPIIYALRADGTKDAVSAIPTFEGTVVGFRLGEDNQYTFSFEYDGEDIWYLNDLKQQTSTLIDAEHSYSFSTAAYDAEARFIISATPIANMPTGCGQIGAEAEKVKKVIINDQLYIIRAGRMYHAVGSIVK